MVVGGNELGFVFHSLDHVNCMWVDGLCFFLLLKTAVCTGADSAAEGSVVISAAAAVGCCYAAVPGSEDEVGGRAVRSRFCVRMCACVCYHDT